jgi:glycosyltransferase involved in cell wall biosynthesis
MANGAPLLLDVTRLVWRRWKGLRPTGIDRLCLAWLHHYAPHAQAVLTDRRGRRIIDETASQALFAALVAEDEDVGRVRRRLLMLAARHAVSLGRGEPGRGRLWLNVGHTGLDVPGLADWCRKTAVRPVLLVHDLIPITHPQYCRAGEDARHRVRMATVIDIGAGLIANSRHTLDSMAEHAAASARPLPPSLVAWPGTERPGTPPLPFPPRPSPAGSADAADFVILGTIEGRKNHMLLLDVWDRLWRTDGPAAPRLVIIGRRGWACDDVLARLDAGGWGDRVVEAGAVDDSQIDRLITASTALLFPSFAEGFGLPLVEAMAAGTPVIASHLPVFHEIGQGVPELLPPDDVAGWEAMIRAYAAPASQARAAQMARIAGFRAPDWPTHFARTDAFLAGLGAG